MRPRTEDHLLLATRSAALPSEDKGSAMGEVGATQAQMRLRMGFWMAG